MEALAVDFGGVGAERARNALPSPFRDPHPAELPHVPVAELAAPAEEDDPVVAVALRAAPGPVEPAGHAEVHQHLGIVRGEDQPLTVPHRIAEAGALDGGGSTAAEKRAVEDLNALDAPPRSTASYPPEALHVG